MATIQQFNFHVDLLKAILWQYNTAQNLQSLLEQKQAWYDENQKKFWENWYRDVFDLNTANDFGLSVWSIILNIPILVVLNPTPTTKPTWGFGEFNKNYENGNFSRSTGGAISLSVDQARAVLKLRYYQITSRGTVTEINKFLASIFADQGRVYVRDNLNMTITYVFNFQPSSQLQFVLEKYDILPRPAGVGISTEVELTGVFGFADLDENFENGNFGA